MECLPLCRYAISPFPIASIVIGMMTFTAADQLKVTEPLVVLGGALMGLLGWWAQLR